MLTVLAYIYGKIANLRNLLYEKGVFETFDLGADTISVGNITAGGTGKTPLAAYIANLLSARGEKVCILTRGYGRQEPERRILVSDGEKILANALEAGDEPLELAQKLLGRAIVIADADRVRAADWAKRKFGATAFVLDDGFQHRRSGRDVDIVCVDGMDPFGGGKMLPAGRLREPVENLDRATAIVITRVEFTNDLAALKGRLSELAPKIPIFECTTAIRNIDSMPRTGGFAFCGIGNPESFFELVRREDIGLAGTKIFRDHHRYTARDIQEIEDQAAAAGASVLLTTAKDAVKLEDISIKMPLIVVEAEVTIDDHERFAELL